MGITKPTRLVSGRTILLLFPSLIGVFILIFLLNVSRSTQYRARDPSRIAPPENALPHRDNWKVEEAPSFCRRLIESPLPNDRCKRDDATQTCPDGSVRMMSQYNQDHYLFTRHFAHLDRRGVYLDVAANNATYISNTYFMDACLGWDGVCVEANPEYHDGLREKRSCLLVPTCVSDKEGERVSFITARGSGAISETNKHVLHLQKQRAKNGAIGEALRETGRLNLSCTTLRKVLADREVRIIDYLSLDVEGHEMRVLKGIDWDKVQVNVVTVEASKKTTSQFASFFKARGYKRHFPFIDGETQVSLRSDLIFLHESVSFGKPA